jgi:hypothetical protein
MKYKHELREFEMKVLRRMFECDRAKVVGNWRSHNEELHNLYTLSTVIGSSSQGR